MKTWCAYRRASLGVKLGEKNLPVCTGPLVNFSLVKSHLLESWRASFSTCLTNENLVCLHTGGSRRLARREKLAKENLPVCTGPLVKFSFVKFHFLESWRTSFSATERQHANSQYNGLPVQWAVRYNVLPVVLNYLRLHFTFLIKVLRYIRLPI